MNQKLKDRFGYKFYHMRNTEKTEKKCPAVKTPFSCLSIFYYLRNVIEWPSNSQRCRSCIFSPYTVHSMLQGDTLDYLGIPGFRIAGGQGVIVIAICQALLMVVLSFLFFPSCAFRFVYLTSSLGVAIVVISLLLMSRQFENSLTL